MVPRDALTPVQRKISDLLAVAICALVVLGLVCAVLAGVEGIVIETGGQAYDMGGGVAPPLTAAPG